MKILAKKYLILIAAAFILGGSAIAGVSYYNSYSAQNIPELNIPMQGSEIPDINITNIASYNNLKKEAMVYKFKKVNNTISDVESLTNKLGLSGKVNSNKDVYFINNKPMSFVFQKATGNWHVYLQNELNYKQVTVPPEEECKKIAINYLKEKGLYNDRFSNVIVTSGTGGGNTGSTSTVIERIVYFYPEIDGDPVCGVSRMSVTIGNNGTVNSVFKTYKDYEPYKTFKLKDPSIAFDDKKNKKVSISIDAHAKKAEIKNVKLAYWEDAGSPDEQPYLQPVWVYSGDATLDDGSIKSFDTIVPALE